MSFPTTRRRPFGVQASGRVRKVIATIIVTHSTMIVTRSG